MPAPDLLRVFLPPLRSANILHMVTGSVAATFYGEPRLTLDIDLVLELSAAQLAQLLLAFPAADFYVAPEEVLAVERMRPTRGHSNIIHHATGLKADLYFVGQDSLARWALGRRRIVQVDKLTVPLAPPEYVILRKLEYFREGGSDKHLRDIRGMLQVLTDGEEEGSWLLDRAFIEQEAILRGLDEDWERCCAD